jgi:hypothetical protein
MQKDGSRGIAVSIVRVKENGVTIERVMLAIGTHQATQQYQNFPARQSHGGRGDNQEPTDHAWPEKRGERV